MLPWVWRLARWLSVSIELEFRHAVLRDATLEGALPHLVAAMHERAATTLGDEPHQTVALHGRAPRPDHGRDGRDREPCADGMHRPGIDQHDGERSERVGASRRDHALAQPRDTGHREHDGGARRRRREADSHR